MAVQKRARPKCAWAQPRMILEGKRAPLLMRMPIRGEPPAKPYFFSPRSKSLAPVFRSILRICEPTR